eukprot:XP_020406365.1 probable alpha,alpha-trehalose-phosphate synthase [UDP-forming] 11 [Zea mays]
MKTAGAPVVANAAPPPARHVCRVPGLTHLAAPRPPRRVIVFHRLPLHASPFGFAFSVDAGTVAYQLRSGLPANAPVLHIGTLPAAAAEAASDELSDYLLAIFSCLPVYLPFEIDMGQLRSVVSVPETEDAGIELKFLAMGAAARGGRELRGRAVLVQIANPACSEGRDMQGVQDEARAISAWVNARFGTPGYTPIMLIDALVTPQEKAAYYAAAECCVENTALGDDSPKRSIIVLSEFVSCSSSLSGAIHVNPWSVESVAEAMNVALRMPEAEQRLQKHYRFR